MFAVEGMRCSACSRALTRALGGLPGVARCFGQWPRAVGPRSTGDPDKVTLRRVLDIVTQTGFKPFLSRGRPPRPRQTAQRRTALKRIGLAGLGMMQTMMFVYCLYAAGAHGIDPGIAQYLKLAGLLIATPVLVYSGAPFFAGAFNDIRRGSSGWMFQSRCPALAYGASVINTLRGVGEIYFDSVTMFIFFLLADDLSR